MTGEYKNVVGEDKVGLKGETIKNINHFGVFVLKGNCNEIRLNETITYVRDRYVYY